MYILKLHVQGPKFQQSSEKRLADLCVGASQMIYSKKVHRIPVYDGKIYTLLQIQNDDRQLETQWRYIHSKTHFFTTFLCDGGTTVQQIKLHL